MAEVLGIVASGITVGQLAGQVSSSIIKLKGYWDEVKDAPSEIRQLLLEIDSLNLILHHIQDDQVRETASEVPSGSIYLEQSLKLCKEGAVELNGLVVELAKKIEDKTGWRRKAGAAKVMLKKEEVKRLKRRMKNAIRLLSLSYQCHTNAMIGLQADVIVARISNTMNSMISVASISEDAIFEAQDSSRRTPESQGMLDMTKDKTEVPQNPNVRRQFQIWISSPSCIQSLIGSLQYWSRHDTNRGKERLEISAKYRCPTWLSDRAWDAYFSQSCSGWKIYLQTHRVLSWYHDIFIFAKTGNITNLQLMLANGQGYVTDRQDSSGRTPLHVAIREGQLEVCKLLLDAGADPSAEDDMGFTAIQQLCRFGACQSEEESVAIDLCRLLINAGASGFDPLIEPPGNDGNYYAQWFGGSPALFRFLQQQMHSPYQELPMKSRLDILETIGFQQNKNAPDIFRLALGDATFTEEMVTSITFWGWTALHYIGLALSDTKCNWLKPCHISSHDLECFSRHIVCYNGNECVWSKLLREVIAAGSLLHATSYSGRTALCTALCEFCRLPQETKPWNHDAKMIQLLNCTLHTWLYDLQASGVELRQYGEQETALGLKDKVNSSRCLNFREERFHLLGFSYGPQLEDWQFYFSEPTDYLAGRFWTMIEKSQGQGETLSLDSQRPIPGAWMEDTELSQSDSDPD